MLSILCVLTRKLHIKFPLSCWLIDGAIHRIAFGNEARSAIGGLLEFCFLETGRLV